MSKPIIQNIDQLSANETTAIDLLNRNYDKLREFIELSVFRDGSTPSEMLADLDMNSKRIINLAEPTSDNQAVRLADLKKYIVEYNNLIEEINAAIDKAYDTIESEGHKQIEALQTLSAQLQAQLLEAVNQGKDVLKGYVEDTLIPELEGFDSDAKKYAANAKDWAVKMDGKVIDPNTSTEVDYSSKYYADLSRQSADASEASAVLAENQANQARTYATNAAASSQSAETFASQAAESATAAASAADTAEAWAVGSIEERPEGSAKYWAEKVKASLAEAAKLYKYANVNVPVASFVQDATYDEYPYKADIVLPEIGDSLVPTVIFSLADSESGNFAPVAESGAGYVRIWAKEKPEEAVVIPTILCQ